MKIDQEKWDRRYSKSSAGIPEPDEFLVSHSYLLGSGTALDLACGLGGNSVFLAKNGYEVHAVDISSRAILKVHEEAKKHRLNICPLIADLDYFQLPTSYYDLVTVFYFFAGRRMADVLSSVKKGGLVFYATYNHRHTSVNPTFNPDYLIPPDGLVQYFSSFDILVSEPDAGENRNISRIIASKAID